MAKGKVQFKVGAVDKVGKNNANSGSVKARMAHNDKLGSGLKSTEKQGFGGIKRK